MSYKTLRKRPVSDDRNGTSSFIPIGEAEGAGPGPTLAIVTGSHGTEFVAHEAVDRFWSTLDPNSFVGRIVAVLAVDVQSVTHASAALSPVDGKNLNRVWPGNPDGTLSDIAAHLLTTEVIGPADAVIDVHGGEWNELLDLYTFTHRAGDQAQDQRVLDFALALGLPLVEVTDVDATFLGKGTCSAEAVRSGRLAAALEVGGAARQEERYIQAILQVMENAQRHLGMKAGKPRPVAGQPVRLDHAVLLRTECAGIYRPLASIGRWLEQETPIAQVLDFDGSVLEEIRTPEAGVVMCLPLPRGIRANSFAAKIGVL